MIARIFVLDLACRERLEQRTLEPISRVLVAVLGGRPVCRSPTRSNFLSLCAAGHADGENEVI